MRKNLGLGSGSPMSARGNVRECATAKVALFLQQTKPGVARIGHLLELHALGRDSSRSGPMRDAIGVAGGHDPSWGSCKAERRATMHARKSRAEALRQAMLLQRVSARGLTAMSAREALSR